MRLPQVSELVGPLLQMIAPPGADETLAQRAMSKAEEEEVRLVSEQIDKEIGRENKPQRKVPKKVVLVGQEGSGESAFISFIYSMPVLC